ncbi:MAG: glycosyltransferase family 1 protein [Chloroflexi bacterium]|nr:MAG: glycosyltransferase family 1 protein [Chloroflexota bacterium]
MRVALFTETFLPKVDGIVTVVCLLLDHLAKRGVESVIVAPRIGDITHYNETEVITVPSFTVPLYPELKTGPPSPFTYSRLKAFQPDVVHLIHPAFIGTFGLLMAKRLGVPTLASFHLDIARITQHFNIGPLSLGFLQPITNFYTRVVFNAADYTLAPSKLIQRDMLDIGIQKVGLWRRGVDAGKFHPRHASAEMRAALSDGHPDETLLLYVGRLSNEKQIDHIKPVLEAVPNTRLAIVGDGPAREDLEAYFDGTPTKFMGYLKGEALYSAYASADIFVFPSAMETFGLVVTEAMAAGLPVVASRVGGIPDVVQEGVTGYTFESGDIDALIDGVRRIATSRARIKQMGQAARAFAETQSWPAMMDEVIDLYAELITTRQAALTA